jgi:HlyD family secretion protein
MAEPEQNTTPPSLRSTRPRRNLVLLVGGAVVGLTMMGWYFFGPSSNGGAVLGNELTYEVKKGDLRVSFTERGNVKASKSVAIYSSLEGAHTIVSVVSEGANVKEGDILVELDSSELTQLYNQQQIAVETASADFLQAQEQLEIQKSLSESEIAKAELDREVAEIDLEKYKSARGDYELAVMKANADVTIAKEELTRAKNKLEWTEKLADKGYVSGTELIADRLAVSKASLQLEQANGAQDLLVQFTHKKDLAKYESTLKESVQALERSKRKATAAIALATAAKRGKESTQGLSKKRLAKLTDQIEKAKIRAPQDGMVVYPNVEPWRRERMIMQGAEVHENQLLMNLPDVSTMAVDVQVHESWVDQVKEGLPALVSIDALPNLNLKGKVTKVGLLPDSVNRWLNPDLKVYQTEITLEDSAEVTLLRPGMSAKVEILIALLDDVIYVPVQSVSTIDKQQVCYVLERGAFVPRPVQGGKYNESFLEIISGLKIGDVVQLNAPAPRGAKKLEDVSEDAALAADIRAADENPNPREKAKHAGRALGLEGGQDGKGRGQRGKKENGAQWGGGPQEGEGASKKDLAGKPRAPDPGTPKPAAAKEEGTGAGGAQ